MPLLQNLRRRLAALIGGPTVRVASPVAAAAELAPPEAPRSGDPAWLVLARADLGIREFPGGAANPAIMRAWKHCDYEPPKGDETSWCSAKLCEWMERAGQPATRAPNARSWLKWGHELAVPKPGAVAVFWRGAPSAWEGHVGLYVGPGDSPGTVKILGGNQGNAVTIADYPEARLLGWRWPTTGGNSRTLRAQQAGAIGDVLTAAGLAGGIAGSGPDLLALGTEVQALAAYWPWFGAAGVFISVLARLATVWARLSDWQAKGV